MIRAGIVSGAGYTAGELIRLLVNHPQAEIAFVQSSSNAGNRLADVHGGLEAEYALGGSIRYDDLLLLAKIIAWECGPAWEDWGILAIGEVVLNRVASPEFPNTIREVLYQTNPMQYEPVWADGWEGYLPNERFVRLALRLLDGERIFDDPTIIFQALFTQGGSTVLAYHDDILDNNTYFCRTNYPDLYARG